MFICCIVFIPTGSWSEFIDIAGIAVRFIGGIVFMFTLTFMLVIGIGMLTLAFPCCSTECGVMMVLWFVCWIVPMCCIDVIPSYEESGIAFIAPMLIRLLIGFICARLPMSPIFVIATPADGFITEVSTIIICASLIFY